MLILSISAEIIYTSYPLRNRKTCTFD